MTKNPKVFISYSWSSPDHQEWVKQLATDLIHSGVEVLIDRWELREGHESTAFMEKMVSDPEVGKVLIITDRVYVEKSNLRQGGAGTEAQIISGELFRGTDVGKFAALIRELDQYGKPYVPAYYTSRIYIDFTDETRHQDSFEQLLRWIFDKPADRKPKLGNIPHFILADEDVQSMSTGPAARRAMDAALQGKSFALAAAEDYFRLFAQEVEQFRLSNDERSIEVVQKYLDDLLPYRNQAVELIDTLTRYIEVDRVGEVLHRFIESLMDATYPPLEVSTWNDLDGGIVQSLAWEFTLHTTALALKNRRPKLFAYIFDTPYLVPRNKRGSRDQSCGLDELSDRNALLTFIDQKMGNRHYSADAAFLKDKPSAAGVSFEQLMEADFIMYLRASISEQQRWMPKTLVYNSGRWGRSFPAFVRARSAREFDRLSEYLGADKDALSRFADRVDRTEKWAPKWGFEQMNPRHLMGLEELCTSP